jgi:RNA polymerase sigma factor (sigma-70 family)
MAMHVSDLTLLERFVSDREEAAFVALVKRHGPRVQGTCRRVLRNEHDVEEVFQATFLLLARKAAAIAWRESVGGWLCAVAHRLALSARADASRQRRREAPFATLGRMGDGEIRLPEQYHPLADPLVEVECRDLREVLDDELLHLPEKYRAPVVLCDLEGRTHQEAAEQLGWPSGSISRRLDHARALLRRRLAHRGVTLAIGLASIGLAAFVATKASHRNDLGATTVRQIMTSLKPLAEGVSGGTSAVPATATPASSTLDPAQMLNLARQAVKAATAIENHDPGRNWDGWRSYTSEMRQSALQLAQATQEQNQLAMLSAARRLDATCVKCHEVFRE